MTHRVTFSRLIWFFSLICLSFFYAGCGGSSVGSEVEAPEDLTSLESQISGPAFVLFFTEN